jgi:hypothetical protein
MPAFNFSISRRFWIRINSFADGEVGMEMIK